MIIHRNIAPALQPTHSFSPLEYQLHTLKNGLPLYVVSAQFEEAIKIDLILNAGSKKSPQKGVASAVNSLISEGTIHKTGEQINEQFDFYGAFLEKEVNADSARLTLYAIKSQLNYILPLFAELLYEAIFNEDELLLFINQHRQKLSINQQKNSFIGRRLFLKTVFGEEHIYGRSMDDKDYLEIKRDALIDFYKNNYSNLDAFIIAAGPIDSSVIKSIDDSLGTLKSLIGATQTEVYSSNMQVQAKKVFVEKQGSVQAALYLGKELFNRQHSDFQPMMVVNTILGGYFGSRLMKKIREEKGYTYGINSALVSHLYGGYFVIQTEVINDLKAQALDEIYKEIETLRNETIPQEEFNLVKNYMIGHLMRSFDNAFAKTERLKTIIEYGLDKEYYSNFVNKILNMKAFEINELAQKYINEQHFCEIVVGA